ncbi:MAG: hypothetical protein HY983_01375 [Candidatus Magasanikbacteria bacterium]|nr:hypothetical protein [Candidatus Magasanikbacteria bacterium]
MPNSQNPSELWREALKLINRCPICSHAYQSGQAKIFAKVSSAGLVHLTCSECQSYFVAMIVVLGHGLSSVGIVTDLNFADASRLYRTETLTTDEIIDGFQTIENKHFIQSLLLTGTFV